MSDRNTTAVAYTYHQNYAILAVNGAFVQATKEEVCIAFFTERIIPEARGGKTLPKEHVREMRVEVRIPVTEAWVVTAQIQGLIRGVMKATDGRGAAFNAPPLGDDMAYSENSFQDLLTEDEKGDLARNEGEDGEK